MANGRWQIDRLSTTRTALIVCLTIVASVAAGSAQAQSVQARISSDEAFVGEVLSVEVTVSDMDESVQPVPPQVQDFEIVPSPDKSPLRSMNTMILNGRRTDSVALTHYYDVRPLRAGRLTLPPFQATYRGQAYATRQFVINVTKDTASSLVLCEIKAPANSVYVGQAVTLTLEIWIQGFKQAGISPMDARMMWSRYLIDLPATSLGVFAGTNLEQIRYAQQSRQDESGTAQQYFVYYVDATVFATTEGAFDFGNVTFAYNYPVRVGRDPFGGVQLQRVRRLRVAATKPPLMVKALPAEGRPADFNGAIGVYSIRASAKPTDVPVGDPITLNIEIRGAGPSERGSLDRLSPPKLDQVEALKRDFEVSGESLAGTVEGDHKTFSQTIRALREDVTEIPAVPMSFFNAETGRYDTAWSEPIALAVKPAQRLVLTNAGGSVDRGSVLAPLSETTEGLFANEDKVELVLADQSGAIGLGSWLLIAAAPLVYVVTWFIQRRAARFRYDVALRRRSRAYGAARTLLRDANGATSPQVIRGALLGYIADRCNVPAAGLTRTEAVRLITVRGIPAEAVQAVDALLESLELAEYGGATGAVQDGTPAARRLVETLERYRLK